jgi:hypothetical protein
MLLQGESMRGYSDGYGNNPARPITLDDRRTVTIETIKATNLLAGKNWFSKDTMSFFKTVVLPTVYHDKYFITSEVDPRGVKRYSIREAVGGGEEIKTVGNFHSFIDASSARDAIRLLV